MNRARKKTIVVGATTNPSRYAYAAVQMLHRNGYEFVPVGIKTGAVLGKQILDLRTLPDIENVDTITLYINPYHQKEWYDYFLGLQPKRIIFNPGTENSELYSIANDRDIECVNACTLVMLSTGQF